MKFTGKDKNVPFLPLGECEWFVGLVRKRLVWSIGPFLFDWNWNSKMTNFVSKSCVFGKWFIRFSLLRKLVYYVVIGFWYGMMREW